MKKILIAVALMFAGLSAVNAQSGLGIKFGANFPSADVIILRMLPLQVSSLVLHIISTFHLVFQSSQPFSIT
jgi:hypothetical protein